MFGRFTYVIVTRSQILYLTGANFNDGTIRASNGATLTIYPVSINNTGGTIESAAGSLVQLYNTTIVGGVLRDVRNVGSSALAQVTVQNGFDCANGTFLYLYDNIDLQGPLKLNSSGGNSTDVRIQTSPFTLAGAGGTTCSNNQNNRIYGVSSGTQVNIGSGHTLRGSCQLGLNQTVLRNDGTILADASGGITIDPTDGLGFTNAGLLRLVAGDVHLAAGAFTNEGAVQVDVGRTITRSGSYTQTGGSTVVNGVLNSSSTVAILGGSLGGSGQVIGVVNNVSGNVTPGNSAGTLTVSQNYFQGSAGQLTAEIGGIAPGAQHDVLAIGGSANLGGKLSIVRIGGLMPTEEQVFVVLTSAGPRKGTFDTVESCDPVTVIYGTNNVSVKFIGAFGQQADLNHDGEVDGADLVGLLSAWGACAGECCPADLNDDGTVDGADFGMLLSEWGS